MARHRKVSSSRMASINRRMWNHISQAWQKKRESEREWRMFGRLVRKIMGPVKGKSLLDLQCGSGEGALCFARLGARVTGADISENRLMEAERKARRARIKADYIRGNVTRLPISRNSFDCVHTGGGVTAWIPDVALWAKEIARVLKPGGRFVWWDGHPVLYCLRQKRRERPYMGDWAGGYFDRRPQLLRGMGLWLGLKRSPAQVEKTWKLSDIQNALSQAGMVFERMEEHAVREFWWFELGGERWRALPRLMLMRWRKPGKLKPRGAGPRV